MNLEKLGQISTFIFDVDGVFTNSHLLITEDGHFLRTMHVRDGYAVKVALKQDYRIVIITGGNSAGVTQRLTFLGIQEVYSAVGKKIDVFNKVLYDHALSPEEVLYMGDDLVDVDCIKKAGLGVCPKDAALDIMDNADWITEKNGGEGCVREVIQKVLEYQLKWVPLHT